MVDHIWKLKVERKVEEEAAVEEETAGDKRTFKILTEIANSIDKDIQMTFEVPSENKENDEYLPYLDTEVKLVLGRTHHLQQGALLHVVIPIQKF